MKFITSDIVQNSFTDMTLSSEIEAALARLKIEKPTGIQQQALPVSFKGHDLIGIGPTGTGKTLIYIMTILARLQSDPTSRALILTPSRETADQVFQAVNDVLNGLAFKTCLVIAGQPDKVQISQLKKNPQVIVATPGRLLEHLAHNKLLLQKLSILVIDEADRMLDQGFGPQLKKIKATLRGDYQTLMFGASFHASAQRFAQDFFRPECYLVKTTDAEKPVSNLQQTVIFLQEGQKKDRLFEVLKSKKGQCMVFVKNQPNSESVQFHLSENGLSCDVIHGGLESGHRDRVIKDFRAGKFQILVTTDLLARGLDIPDLAMVINFDLPNETEDFLHRIGRTARAGKTGMAVTFVSRSETEMFSRFSAYVEGAEQIH